MYIFGNFKTAMKALTIAKRIGYDGYVTNEGIASGYDWKVIITNLIGE